MMLKFSKVEDATLDCVLEAEDQFGVDLSNLTVDMNFKSVKVIARAIRHHPSYDNCHTESFTLRFNPKAIAYNEDQFIKVVIPHEVAHLVCMALGTDKGHGEEWKRVDALLGGDGSRIDTSGMYLGERRRNRKFRYIATCGKEVVMTATRHGKIQRGFSYRLKTTGGLLDSTCSFMAA